MPRLKHKYAPLGPPALRIFETGRERLAEAKEIGFKNEPELRRPFDENFAVFFPGLERVKSECVLDDVRLDTLAFDKTSKTFVIIEYKRDATKRDIFAQGLSYYKQLQRHQADCVEFLSEKRGRTVMRKEIAWRKTRLIFVSAHFSKHQIRANWDDPPIELRQVRKYHHYLVVSKPDVSDDKRKKLKPDPLPSEYSEADWLDGKYGGQKPTPQLRDLYFALKKVLLDKFQLERIQQKRYANFKLASNLVCRLQFNRHKLQIIYSTTKKDLLPFNDFVKSPSPSIVKHKIGHHCSYLSTESDISRVIEYVGPVCEDTSSSDGSGDPTEHGKYSEADWLDGKYGGPKPTPQVRDLYFVLKNTLIDKFQLEHIQRKRWASFRLEGTEACSVVVQKFKLRLVYSTFKRDLLPPTDFIHDVSGVGKFGRGHYRSDIETKSDVLRAVQYVDLVCQDVSGSGV